MPNSRLPDPAGTRRAYALRLLPARAMAPLRAVALALALFGPVPAGVAVLLAPAPALAVTPSEQLADPELEARARAISRLLRCPQCQSETIDDSDAPIAADLRRYVRERLLEGDSDQEVIDRVVARFGEFVLFLPPRKGVNLLLWGAGPLLLLLAVAIAIAAARRRTSAAPPALSPEEEARLNELTRG